MLSEKGKLGTLSKISNKMQMFLFTDAETHWATSWAKLFPGLSSVSEFMAGLISLKIATGDAGDFRIGYFVKMNLMMTGTTGFNLDFAQIPC